MWVAMGSRCALALLTNADLKADITLLCNTISKQKSCSFNSLTRVGAHASHGSKIKIRVNKCVGSNKCIELDCQKFKEL